MKIDTNKPVVTSDGRPAEFLKKRNHHDLTLIFLINNEDIVVTDKCGCVRGGTEKCIRNIIMDCDFLGKIKSKPWPEYIEKQENLVYVGKDDEVPYLDSKPYLATIETDSEMIHGNNGGNKAGFHYYLPFDSKFLAKSNEVPWGVKSDVPFPAIFKNKCQHIEYIPKAIGITGIVLTSERTVTWDNLFEHYRWATSPGTPWEQMYNCSKIT